MAELKLTDICKRYGSLTVIEKLSLAIDDGEFVVLVGPSGCGKSTLLRMIAGLEAISAGDLMIGGARANDIPPQKRDTSMVFQSYALFPHMSVRDNISFGPRVRGEPKDETERRIKKAAEILNLGDYLDRKPGQLSGGQRQRVAMGRAIVRDPKVFLFDEPLSNLDAKLRIQMRTEIKALHQKLGTTIVYVTHDQIEAMTMADRIVVMNGGNIEQVGSPLELYDNPANTFVAGFIGSPANCPSARATDARSRSASGLNPMCVTRRDRWRSKWRWWSRQGRKSMCSERSRARMCASSCATAICRGPVRNCGLRCPSSTCICSTTTMASD